MIYLSQHCFFYHQAFQCRKCRHINYDRLDAFLCVECGYCSSGSFSYEISVSPSSRAVAIVDDEGLESAIRLMLVTSNKYNEYKCVLTKRLQNASSLSGTMRQRDRIEASMSKLNSPLKRAFLGDLPKIGSKKSSRTSKRRRGPVNDSLDAENHVETSSDVNRARSLLNLALTGGVPDSLSRLVANIARARTVGMSRRNKRNRDETNDEKQESPEETSDGEPASANTEALSIKAIESCDKLYFQMRQLERESFEFRKRIEAWKRLNHDALANYGSEPNLTNVAYGTSQCSFCSSKISHHLLELIHVLFTSRNNTHLRNASVFKKFVCLLFNEGIDSIHPDLVNLKRSTIIAIATESSLGSEMVFNELKMRLQGSQSVACAEILGDLIGSLVAEDVQSYDQFIQLALQILK
jgi:E3 ubiquitin-protein ligase UBR4